MNNKVIDVPEIEKIIRQLHQVEQKYKDRIYATGEVNVSIMASEAASTMTTLLEGAQNQYAELLSVKKEFRTCRNELCLRCGRYFFMHEGQCDGCRWKEIQ